MAKLKWELLARDDDNTDLVTWRARVPGGWLVSVWAAKATDDGTIGLDFPGGANRGGGLTFFQCGETEWDVETVPTGKKGKSTA